MRFVFYSITPVLKEELFDITFRSFFSESEKLRACGIYYVIDIW